MIVRDNDVPAVVPTGLQGGFILSGWSRIQVNSCFYAGLLTGQNSFSEKPLPSWGPVWLQTESLWSGWDGCAVKLQTCQNLWSGTKTEWGPLSGASLPIHLCPWKQSDSRRVISRGDHIFTVLGLSLFCHAVASVTILNKRPSTL